MTARTASLAAAPAARILVPPYVLAVPSLQRLARSVLLQRDMPPGPQTRMDGAWILVADADLAQARVLARRLRRQGLWAVPTARGDDALRLARACPFDLALVDARVEDMAGPELAARLRTIDRGLPVIMTAAADRTGSEQAAREAGVVHYALKPVAARRLRAAVVTALRRREARGWRQVRAER